MGLFLMFLSSILDLRSLPETGTWVTEFFKSCIGNSHKAGLETNAWELAENFSLAFPSYFLPYN